MRRHVFPDALYNPAPVPSWWAASAGPAPDAPPLAGDTSVEVAIIGGGFAGLSTAYHLAKEHGIEALVLEAGHIGWGSSGRNAGFVCMPASKLGLGQLIQRYGLDETRRFVDSQREAMALVGSIIDDEAIDVQRQGRGHWQGAHTPQAFLELKDEAALLTGTFGLPTRLAEAATYRTEVAAGSANHGGLQLLEGFGLHPLRYLQGLARAAQARGAGLQGHSRVLSWHKVDGWHHLTTASGTVRARNLVSAANGWLDERLLPTLGGRMLPVISNILVTRPLTAAERRAENFGDETPVLTTQYVLNYYRLLPDGRLLFGTRGDTDGTEAAARKRRAWLERRLATVFPALAGIETTHYWRGLVALTRSLLPSIGRLPDDPSVLYTYGCHGNGIHHMTWSGRQLAGMIRGKAPDAALLPGMIQGLTPRFPLPGLRRWYLKGAYALMERKDRA